MNQMNHHMPFLKTFSGRSRLIGALFAAFFLISSVRGLAVENRFLLIFNTSANMKKCLPVTKVLMGELFLSMMNGQLQRGDSIGVWTFASKVRFGQLPSMQWQPEGAASIASNIVTYVERQNYSKKTDFAAVTLMLNNVMQNSDRLTVLIFCDGDGEMTGTPYDDAINAVFQQNRAMLQKSKQPFIVVLRSQFGEYVGCKIGSAAATIAFPPFPPLPVPPVPLVYDPPKPVIAPAPRPAAAITAPPLVIVGTTVGTNVEMLTAPRSVPKPVAPVIPAAATTNAAPLPVSNSIPLTPPGLPVTNAVAPTKQIAVAPQPDPVIKSNIIATPTNFAAPAITRTNAVVPPKENSPRSGGVALAIGVGLLLAAGGLGLLLWHGLRRPDHRSLITRSLNKD